MISDYSIQIGKKLALKSHFLNISNIICITCNDYICTVYLTDEKITISKQLKTFESDLQPFGFIRINRSTLINLLHLKRFFYDTKEIVMTNDISFSISRRKITAFKKELSKAVNQ